MFKKLLFLLALFLWCNAFVSANSLITWTNWFDLLEYNVVDWNKIELVFSQPLIEEPMNVELFDSSNNLLLIDSIDYLSWRTIAVLNIWENIVSNSVYKLNILSVFWTTWFIAQSDNEFVDIKVDWTFDSNVKEETQTSAQDLFNQKLAQNSTNTHNTAQDKSVNTDLFGDNIESEGDLFLDNSLLQENNENEQSDTIASNVVETNLENNSVENDITVSPTSLVDNVDSSESNKESQSWSWSSVITWIPKTWPASNILLLLALLSSWVYFLIRKNVVK